MPTTKDNISKATAATGSKQVKSAKVLKAQKAEVATDSVDSVAAAKPKYEPRFTEAFPDSSGNSLKIVRPENARVMTVPGDATAATPRTVSPLYDNGSMLLVLAVIFITTVSYRKGYKYVADFFHNISSVRERQNLFEDHTVKETQIMARGLRKKGAGRRASQRIYVEIEIYALEGGGGEELLAGGKEEAAHTCGTVAGGSAGFGGKAMQHGGESQWAAMQRGSRFR